MDKIYLVHGYSGQWSDAHEWVICGYKDKALAEEHVKLAEAHQQTLYDMLEPLEDKLRTDEENDRYYEIRHSYRNPYDYRTSDGYDRTSYSFEEVEVLDKILVVDHAELDRIYEEENKTEEETEID